MLREHTTALMGQNSEITVFLLQDERHPLTIRVFCPDFTEASIAGGDDFLEQLLGLSTCKSTRQEKNRRSAGMTGSRAHKQHSSGQGRELVMTDLLDRKTWILSQPFETVFLIAIQLTSFPLQYY